MGRRASPAGSAGAGALEIADALATVRVELVLTARPTQAKRATIREHHRALYLLLVRRADPRWTPYERRTIEGEVLTLLTPLWRTGEIFLGKPDVASERRSILHYLRNVFPEALPRLDQRLREAWADAGLDPAAIADPLRLPRLQFGTWVGGGRDGHPLVSAEVTGATLAELQDAALRLARAQLEGLARQLSLSDQLQAPPPELLARLAGVAAQCGAAGGAGPRPQPQRAVAPVGQSHAGPPSAPPRARRDALPRRRRAFRRPPAVGRVAPCDRRRPHRRRGGRAGRPQRAGLRLPPRRARHRQNSRFHDQALGQLLHAAGASAADFADWDEPRRLALIDGELGSPRPFTRPEAPVGPGAEAVLSSYRAIAAELRANGWPAWAP